MTENNNYKLGAAFLGAAVFLGALTGNAAAANGAISFYNTHTGERVTADPDTAAGRRKLNHILRDFRTGRVAEMNPRLYDTLQELRSRIKQKTGITPVFHIISGKRDSETNEMLRRAGGAQAKNSQHILGKAIDIRVPGVPTRTLRDIAFCMQAGGVGYYPENSFVHVDVGRVRTWGGNGGWGLRVRCH